MKKPNVLLREYASRLSDVELRDIGQRLSQRLSGDYAEAAQMLQRDREVDQWLRTSDSADSWFEMLETVLEVINREQKRRESVIKEPKKESVAIAD